MYSKTAQWYDALYRFKEYQAEAEQITARIRAEHPDARTILDVGCGTAEHDRFLTQEYQVDGLDITPDFVRIAAAKNPAGRYFCADMADFSLPMHYDVILCLFSAIGYVKTLARLVDALVCFRCHMNPGGIILVEPWFTPETFHPEEKVYLLTGENDQGKICRMNVSRCEGRLSILDFHYLLGTAAGIEYLTERHELGLFTEREMLEAFAQAGLAVSHDPEGLTGRGLYTARAIAHPPGRR